MGYWWRCNLCCMLKNMNILSISFSQVPCFLTVSFPMYLFQACLKNWYPFVYLLYLRLPLISHHLYFKTCKKSAFITALFQSGLHLAASLCLGQEESWPFTSHATDSHPERKQLIISWQFLTVYTTPCVVQILFIVETQMHREDKNAAVKLAHLVAISRDQRFTRQTEWSSLFLASLTK